MLSEAAYLDVVTPDARRGATVRLCRHPQEGYAWLWGHVFLDGRIYAFTQHDAPCDAAITPVDSHHVVYRSEGGWSRLTVERNGALNALRGVMANGVYSMHDLRHAPLGPGPLTVSIEASFLPATTAVSNLAGRSEVLGDVHARIAIGQHAFELVGGGQYHEQVQTEPRFTTPFTYGTLRGERAGIVFIRGARGARGHWIERDASMPIDRIELAPPGSTRAIRLYGNQRLREGVLKTTYDYTIAIGDGVRFGTLVKGEIDGVALSGCVNDYLVDELRYERI
jgi:hypothetical protein